MRKIALPVDEEKLSPHFGNCKCFVIYRIKKQSIIDKSIFPTPQHQPGSIPAWLIDQDVTDIIANGIGHRAIEIFNQHKINVFVGAEIKNPEDLIEDYLNGILKTDGNFCNH